MKVIEHATAKTLDWKHYEAKAPTMSDDELAHARSDCFTAAQAMRGSVTEGLYMDELSVYAREQKARREARA